MLKQWDAGHKRTLVVLPTGTGKTCVFSKVVENQTGRGRRALILAHRSELLAKQLAEMRKRKAKLVDPLQYALSIVAEELMNYTPSFAWEAAPPTQAQLDAIENYGLSTSGIDCKGKASILLNRLGERSQKGLSTPKQIRCLERYGFRKVGTWSFHEASGMLNQIADNGWYVPWGVNVATYTPQRWGTGRKIAQLKLIQSVENTP